MEVGEALKQGALRFALRAAGAAGVAFGEFRAWLSPFGWTGEDLEGLLRAESRAGRVELEERPRGGISRLRLTASGESLIAPATGGGA